MSVTWDQCRGDAGSRFLMQCRGLLDRLVAASSPVESARNLGITPMGAPGLEISSWLLYGLAVCILFWHNSVHHMGFNVLLIDGMWAAPSYLGRWTMVHTTWETASDFHRAMQTPPYLLAGIGLHESHVTSRWVVTVRHSQGERSNWLIAPSIL